MEEKKIKKIKKVKLNHLLKYKATFLVDIKNN